MNEFEDADIPEQFVNPSQEKLEEKEIDGWLGEIDDGIDDCGEGGVFGERISEDGCGCCDGAVWSPFDILDISLSRTWKIDRKHDRFFTKSSFPYYETTIKGQSREGIRMSSSYRM
tara:strand:- start:2436 stop:2783 length:348 start_codon:yes stop_codon:yes gene_type:complete